MRDIIFNGRACTGARFSFCDDCKMARQDMRKEDEGKWQK